MNEVSVNDVQSASEIVAKQLTQQMTKAHELIGMIKMGEMVKKFLNVGTLKVLAEIKETKQYNGLMLNDVYGEYRKVTTWADFCAAIGFNVVHIDENLKNLNQFGEDFLETSQRLGLGYREMRKLRQLPEEARAEIIDADYSEATDKEDLIEKIEDLTAKFAHEKKVLEGQLKQSQANYEAQSKVLANKNARIDELDTKLAKKEQAIAVQSPEEKGGVLREETARISYKAEAILRGQVWQAFEALEAHSTEHSIDHKQFMSGVLAEYQLILSELKAHFNINDQPSDDDLPEWARETE